MGESPAHTFGAALRKRFGHSERNERSSTHFVLRFLAVEPRQQVQISSLLKLAGPFAVSRWVASEQEPADALVIGLATAEGRLACQTNRLDAMALPALLLGTPEQARQHAGREPASVLVLSPPFRHLSLYYCLDVLAQQCAELKAARANAGERCLRLVGYPPASVLKADGQHVRLASFLFALPLSARELGDISGCDAATVQRFLHACDRLGLIQVAAERRSAVPSRRTGGDGLTPRLVLALRNWLGF
jgi:hypothetical protein